MREAPREILVERLQRLDARSLRRQLSPRRGIDFSSNDYLGFSRDEALSARVVERLSSLPIGASGSRLLRGNLKLFEAVEKELADFSGREAATLFPSGYQANLGLLSALLTEEDAVFSDERNHASIIDGIRLARARKHVFPHRDVAALRELLARSSGARLQVIVTESLFSMDGDRAPLEELARLARELSALLVVDEAHATGLWGAGLVQEQRLSSDVFATIHTGGKALGAGGAWIAGDEILKDYLVNFSRPFIFSTAPLPALAVSLSEAVGHWKRVGAERARKLHGLSETLRRSLGLDVPGPIFPVILGGNERALFVSQALRERGFDVRAIRPPTVAPGTARLRITLNCGLSEADIADFTASFAELARRGASA